MKNNIIVVKVCILPLILLYVTVIPFGLIGSPQSTPDLPAYVFKAQVGNDLARQIAHHFDTTGMYVHCDTMK